MAKEIVEPSPEPEIVVISQIDEEVQIVFEELDTIEEEQDQEQEQKSETVFKEPKPEPEPEPEPKSETVFKKSVIEKKQTLRLYQKVKYTPKLFGVIIEIKKKYDKTYYRVQFENSEMSSWFKESNLKVETIADLKERLGFR